VLDYCSGGDLKLMLRQDGALPATIVRDFAAQILSGLTGPFCSLSQTDVRAGLHHLHSRSIINCQVYPSKVMLGDEHLCLSDLGRSVNLVRDSEPLDRSDTDALVSHYSAYLSPEVGFLLAVEPRVMARSSLTSAEHSNCGV
jgi:serine/threonine protein kinase